MKKNIGRSIILLSIMIVLFLSVTIASARDDRLSKEDFIIENEEVKDPLLIKPNINVIRENGKVGEDKITPYYNMEDDPDDTEDNYRNSLVVLGNQATKTGSNDFAKLPTIIILAITSLFTIIFVCFIRRK